MLRTLLSTPAGTVRLVAGVTAIALLAAILPWQYGYYQLLRVVVFFAGIYCGVMLRKSQIAESQQLAWVAFGAALLFNPFIPVELPRFIWALLDFAGAILFGFIARRER